jgi:signal transduction histidine kinase
VEVHHGYSGSKKHCYLQFTIYYSPLIEAQWAGLITSRAKLQFSRDRSHKSFAGLFQRQGASMTELDKNDPANTSEESKTAGDNSQAVRQSEGESEKIRALEADHKAKMDEVADLITRVRHEINNPLTGVLGQAQLLLREDLSERARKRAQTIEEMAIRIRDIVAQLRQVQKL